jgi:4-amino-4-deoxy-L-arabinose transferase-like glycosyltransferase
VGDEENILRTNQNRAIHFLIVILTMSVFLRIVSAVYLGDQVEILPGTYDQISYHNLALRVLDGHGFSFGEYWWPLTKADAPTAHWSYLYTFYLVLIYQLSGSNPLIARLIQAVIVGIAQPVLIYLIGRRLFGEPVGLVSAFLTAVYAYFVYYSATLMTEPFYITAILTSLYLLILVFDHTSEPISTRNKGGSIILALGLGLSLGLAVLFRQIFLLIIPILFIWISFLSLKRRRTSTVAMLILSLCVIILMILPFTIYNYMRFHRFVLLNTNAGYALYWANHPIYGTRFVPLLPAGWEGYRSLIPQELHNQDEAALDQELLRRGFEFMISDPARMALLSISRIPIYFTFWPSSESSMISNISRVSSFGLFWPFMLVGLFLSFIRTQAKEKSFLLSPDFLLLLFAGTYTAVHLLSWTLIRYRLPVDAVMLIYAGLAIVQLAHRLKIFPRNAVA